MRFEIEGKQFAVAAKRAGAVVASRNTIPVLACVHIVADSGEVRVTGSDANIWATATARASVPDHGSICVNSAQLSAWLSAITPGSLVSVTASDGKAHMTAGLARASFFTLPSETFPLPNGLGDWTEVPDAVAAMSVCLPYVDPSDYREYLQGVAIDSGHAIATNGHRLCVVDLGAKDSVSAIIPFDGARQIVVAGNNSRLFVSENMWRCESEGFLARGKMIEGKFPEWQRMVPSNLPLVAEVDADTLSSAARMVAMATEGKARAVKFSSDGSSISVSCRGAEMDAESSAPCEGQPFNLTMNAKYAEAALATFSGRVVEIYGGGSDGGPNLLTSRSAPGLRVLVMGMRA